MRWLRLALDDQRSPPVAFTGARLHASDAVDAPAEPVAATVKSREEVDGEGTEREDSRIKGEAQTDHVPVRPVEAQNAAHLQFVNFAGFTQLVLLFRPALQYPVNDRA